MKKKLLVLSVLFLLAGAAVWYFMHSGSGSDVAYLTEPVRKGNIVRIVNAAGELGAVELVTVGAQVGGQITRLHVAVGQKVKKGDPIAEIDSVPQLNQLETDKARLESYEAQLAAKKVNLRIAQTQYDRENRLSKRDAASKESLEDARNALALAKAEVAELESLIRQTRISVNTDEVNLGYTRITSPLDGTVMSVPVDEGQTVNANQTTPTIAQIADLTRLENNIEISEGDVTSVRPGMAFTYTILSEPDREFRAELTSIDPGLTTLTDGSYKSSTGGASSSSATSGTAVYYYAKALIANPDGLFRIGMTTQNSITVAEARDVLTAPAVSVFSRRGRYFARILEADGTVTEKEVTVGLSDGVRTEIRSGLSGGEAAITAQVTQQELEARTRQRGPGPRLR